MKIEITEKELVTRSHHGSVYVCRSCYDLRQKIVMVRYVVGAKKEVVADVCDDCLKAMESCSSCKKHEY